MASRRVERKPTRRGRQSTGVPLPPAAAGAHGARMLPDGFRTDRLVLRPIAPEDAGPIFDAYAQDAEVTRFLTWRPHRSRGDPETNQPVEETAAQPKWSGSMLRGTAAV